MKPIITRRLGGEYSTIVLPDGTVETMWFPNIGDAVMVGRTGSVRSIAAEQIREFEEGKS